MKKRKAALSKRGSAARPVEAKITAAPLASRTTLLAICLVLSAATLLVYFQTFGYGFVRYDDHVYVYENPRITAGISASGLSYAFTTFDVTNWHPLTWVSYLLVYQFFGINPGVEHVVNVLLHIGAMVLLFLALEEMTRKPWRCALVAAIFGLHPVHVESVVWISERKDVLSAFFLMLTLFFYARYAARGTPGRYALVAFAFLLSLLAKPMAVTLPFVLLLLDLWPLRRLESKTWRSNLQGLVLEKLPLLALSAAASSLTYMAQQKAMTVGIPFSARFANAATAYVGYLGKAFWPADLALLYPLGNPSPGTVLLALTVLVVITATAGVAFRQRPYLLVGWLWYLGTLVPVIGLVQVGRQFMADRYTYVPLVGFSIALVWAVSDAVEGSPALRRAAAALAGVVLIAMPVAAYRQAGYWKDTETLFRHAIAATGDNPVMEGDLAMILQREGRNDEAESLYRKSVASDPRDDENQANLGVMVAARAASELSEAGGPTRDPGERQALTAAGEQHLEEARQHLAEAVRLKPANADAQADYCFVLQHLGRLDQAMTACEAALKVKPDSAGARFNLANTLLAQGKTAAAETEFSRVLQANPKYEPARAALEHLRGQAAAPAQDRH